MTIENDFHALVSTDAAVVALISDNLTQNGVEEGTSIPYAVYTTSHDRLEGLGGVVFSDNCTITVQCWAADAAQADAVADAIEAVLRANQFSAMRTIAITSRQSGYDGDLNLDATVLGVEWWADT